MTCGRQVYFEKFHHVCCRVDLSIKIALIPVMFVAASKKHKLCMIELITKIEHFLI